MSTATTTPTPTRRRPAVTRMLAVEVVDEVKQTYREPTALFFSVVMPVLFFALLSSLFGGEPGTGGAPAGTTMLATFGAYGVVVAVMMNPGIGLAAARERGWLTAARTSPVPIPVVLGARVLAALPFCVAILVAMTGTAAALGVLEITLGRWFALMVVLVLGCLPFSLVGIAIGAQASGQATAAILNAIVLPLAIAGGLWFPLEMMPDWVGTIAVGLPTHHLAELALVPLDGGDWIGHVVYLLGFTAVVGALAAVSYRRSRT